MRDVDLDRLRAPYDLPVEPVPDDRRLNDRLDLGIDSVIDLADAFFDDLDPEMGGIGWWRSYERLGRQERVFISDYLIACARSVYQNLSESYAYRLEFDHAVSDFQRWIEPGVREDPPRILAPTSLYDDLSYVRVMANLTGIFRAFASALDCIGACLVGVAGLPIDIIKTDLGRAKRALREQSATKPRLKQLHDDLVMVERSAGPSGWLRWLLAMRHMLVHRGRRIVAYSITQGSQGEIEDFSLVLPRSPELTDVQGWLYATGTVAASFVEPADSLLTRLSETTCRYVGETGRLLLDLWGDRKQLRSLIEQPEQEWPRHSGLVLPAPSFAGYHLEDGSVGQPSELGVSDEVSGRMRAAGMTRRDVGELRPSPTFWS